MLRVIVSVLTVIVNKWKKWLERTENLCLNKKKNSFTDAMSTTEEFGDLHYVLYKLSNERLHTRSIFVLNQFSRSITSSSEHFHYSIRDWNEASVFQVVCTSWKHSHLQLDKTRSLQHRSGAFNITSSFRIEKVYLFRFSSRISAPLLLLMLLSSDLMDSSAAFTSAATDLSQLFRRLHTQTQATDLRGGDVM